jgi:hypothetical protein
MSFHTFTAPRPAPRSVEPARGPPVRRIAAGGVERRGEGDARRILPLQGQCVSDLVSKRREVSVIDVDGKQPEAVRLRALHELGQCPMQMHVRVDLVEQREILGPISLRDGIRRAGECRPQENRREAPECRSAGGALPVATHAHGGMPRAGTARAMS